MNQNSKPKTNLSKAVERLMIHNIPVIHPTAAIAEIEDLLLKKTKEFETINYIYIVDKDNMLQGVVSVKEIFRSPKIAKVYQLMRKELITVHPHTHQETAAILAIKHNLKAIPIVDSENHFLGVLPSDAILNILHEEHVEDLMRFAGVHSFRDPAKNIIKASTWIHIKKRLPWLALGLVGGIVAAGVVSFFEQVIKTQLMLAVFIPLIVYMADAVGTQTETIYIRSLALEHNLNTFKYILREIKIGLSIGIILGFTISLVSYWWVGSVIIGVILGLSIFITNLVAVMVAMFLPWLFSKFKLDPAFASGPFATVIQDILSLVVYFAVAQMFLRM